MSVKKTSQILKLKLKKSKLAIIDIGSNSVRLVIYPDSGKYPYPLFNERINCRLGEKLFETGKLSTRSISRALKALQRFSIIINNMEVKYIIPVATAAVRNSKNSNEFILPAEKILSSKIRILTKNEEAELAALGLITNVPIKNGIIADLGGGSLEIILIKKGKIKKMVSVDIGHLIPVKQEEILDLFKSIKWLTKSNKINFYGTGGSFRSLGSAYIKNTDYPLYLIHGLSIKTERAVLLLDKIMDSKEEFAGIPQNRMPTIRNAANIMQNLILVCDPKKIIISGTSIRDGIVSEINPSKILNPDKASNIKYFTKNQRFVGMQSAIKKFFDPLMERLVDPKLKRLFKLACQLSDISWNELSDLRGSIAAERIISLPLKNLLHKERIWLAQAIYHRYVGLKDKKSISKKLINLLSEKEKKSAFAVGIGLRFLYTFSAGNPKNLDMVNLNIKNKKLICTLKPKGKILFDTNSERRLKAFANGCNLEYKIVDKNI
ncbi:MAG: hypothetical protein CMN44_08495 [SAR116 cluster bacterium]|nr:hypothetical protein [SAR116 cluster bacterium]RPH08743.1 MAG: hypothetical protein CBC14_008365 [Alphaproteobacteria bacterium TMED54]